MRYYFCVTSKKNWEIVKKECIWAVSENRRGTLMSVKPKDKLVVYVSPKQLGGIFEVTSEPYEDRTRIFVSRRNPNELFPYRIRIKPLLLPKEPINFIPLISKLSFIKRKKRWTVYLTRAMFEISEEDFKLIEKYFKKFEKKHFIE